jgi:hypothetical protein
MEEMDVSILCCPTEREPMGAKETKTPIKKWGQHLLNFGYIKYESMRVIQFTAIFSACSILN